MYLSTLSRLPAQSPFSDRICARASFNADILAFAPEYCRGYQAQADSNCRAPHVLALHVSGGHDGRFGQVVGGRLLGEEEERVEPLVLARVALAVEIRLWLLHAHFAKPLSRLLS